MILCSCGAPVGADVRVAHGQTYLTMTEEVGSVHQEIELCLTPTALRALIDKLAEALRRVDPPKDRSEW